MEAPILELKEALIRRKQHLDKFGYKMLSHTLKECKIEIQQIKDAISILEKAENLDQS